jgi:RimJ/RimL family protein N-acetyltransferase
MEHKYPPAPITLNGQQVTLIPLEEEHISALAEAVKDGALWNLWYTLVPSPNSVEGWVKKAIEEKENQLSLPFVVKAIADNKIVGSTRFMNIEKDIRRLEIGSTWYSKSVQRSFVNTECKLLLLQHAFENLECKAVEFRTHRLNQPSRSAIERLGANQDGILRNHRVMPNGTIRDTVVYSILDNEWPMIKSSLLFKLSVKY